MTTAKSIPTTEMNEIQRRMAQIRRELHEEVREAVKGAQSLTNWRSQVRNHPWLGLGAAVAVGYLIVPKRRRPELPTVVAVNPVSSGLGVVPSASLQPSSPPPKSRSWILGPAFSLLAPIAVRAAQNYAIQYLEQWLAAQPGGPEPATVADSGPRPGAQPRPTSTSSGTRPSAPFGVPGRSGDAR